MRLAACRLEMAQFALVSDMYLVNNVGVQVADVPRSAPLKSKLMWPALALTAAMVTTQVGPGISWGWTMQMMCWLVHCVVPCWFC